MARPLRIEYPGAVYHVTSRGNAREPIFADDADRRILLQTLEDVICRYNWICHAYCLMGNHYHLMLETVDPNLSLGMRQLNGVYTQRFNRHHQRVGHVFQGRYKAILVEKNAHLLELCRYIVLNPIRACLVDIPEKWPWSSYLATSCVVKAPVILTVDWILAQFGKTRSVACPGYRKFVAAGISDDASSPWKKLAGGFVFGGMNFVADIQNRLDNAKEIGEIPRSQRYPGRPPLKELFSRRKTETRLERNRLIVTAHEQYGYTLKEIADQLAIHYTTVSKVLKQKNLYFKT